MDDTDEFTTQTPDNEDELFDDDTDDGDDDDNDNCDVDSNQSVDNIDDDGEDEDEVPKDFKQEEQQQQQQQQHDYDLTLSSWNDSDKLSDKLVTLDHDFSSKSLFDNMHPKSRLYKRICNSSPIIATKILTRNLKVTSIQCAYLDAATHKLATRIDIN